MPQYTRVQSPALAPAAPPPTAFLGDPQLPASIDLSGPGSAQWKITGEQRSFFNGEVSTMCLGVPGRVVAVDGLLATVDFWGVRRDVRLDVVDEPVEPGDYILNHVGFAIRKIPSNEIEETLALYAQLLQEAENDIMAADVRSEIEAGAARDQPSGDDA